MGRETRIRKATDNASPSDRLKLRIPGEARILIVSDDDSIAERLNIAFREGGLISEHAKSMTAGCEFARSGRFQVVVTTPVLGDGSWRRLIDLASHYDLGFVVVLVASNLDFNQRAEAMEEGAFDVLDVLHELPKTAEAAQRALWAAYLKGVGPGPEVANPSKAA